MKLKQFGIVSAILVCLVVSLVYADGTLVIKQQGDSGLTEAGIKALNQAISTYPMSLSTPSSRIVIVKTGIFSAKALGGSETNNAAGWPHVMFPSGNMGDVAFNIATNAETQMQNVVVRSYLSHGLSSRPSTWGRGKPLNVQFADFMGHYVEGTGIEFACSAQNLGVMINSVNYRDKALTSKETEVLANKILVPLFSSYASERVTYQSGVLQIQYKRQSQSSAIISWTADASLKDYWIRMDVDHGSLTILGEGKVLLVDLPNEGAKVHCLSISPDGKTVYGTILDIPSKEPVAGRVKKERGQEPVSGLKNQD